MDVDLRRLRLFVEVVRQGGFSQAAKVVFATQPTVSKAVKQLEDELGVPLLNRVGHRSELTAAGKIVYRRAVSLLTEGEDLIAELDELRGLKRGTLHLGFPRVGSSALFAPMFASFRRRYPGVDVELVVHDCKRLEESLLAGELDLAALVHPIAQDFDWQDVRTEPLVVLLPRDHALAGQETIRLSRLAEFPFILFEEGFALNEVILGACRDKGITPKIAARSSQVDFIFELVAAGVGIAFLPRVLAEQRPHRIVQRVLLDEPKCKWRIALAWRRGGYLSHAARAWLAHAREEHAKTG
ncbi:LysR family transcriptional regulator [Polaromonas jejuensis]|uniref:LysR family transcriptional regulator n=1 Tax=Polaromonas jejuensis TaxID=457502 RepID=A0ABW0QDL5_9BURK|nr:LysR family transcriptional regulator [Polaromonas jejuensis]